jgi:maleamate amidohydrolase
MADTTQNTDDLDSVIAMYRARGVGKPLGFGDHVALLIIDFQNAYTRTWRAQSTEPVQNTATLLAAARAQGLPVYFTYQGIDPENPPGGIFGLKAPTLLEFTRGSWDCEIDELIAPVEGEPVIEKQAFSAFFGSDLAQRMKDQGVDTIVICGCSLSGCVRATVVDGMQHGFRMMVPRACVSDASAPSLRTSLMEITIKYGDVIELDEALAGITASERVPA